MISDGCSTGISGLGWIDWDGNTKYDGDGDGDDEAGVRVAETGYKAAVVVRQPAEFA